MVKDDILGVMGVPRGFREVWGTPGSKKSDKLAFLT